MRPTPSTSASPAPFLRRRSVTQHADGPSPSKRRKLATPSSSSSSFCHLHHSPDPQLDTERRASSSRVLSVWSALEDKYACRLDEDDIVDLRSGGLVKDRGVLSGKAGTWDIGCFADLEEAQGQENIAQDGDVDEDEIGVWDSDTELDHCFNPVHVPPVRELDPKDAEDLRAFLAAEEARKALHGADDESEDEAEISHSRGDDHNEKSYVNVETDESILEVEAGSALALSSTESDDELAGYDETVGEGALLWEVSTELSNCSEPLGADVRMTPHPPRALPRRNQTPAQLCTPPLSRSSMRSPNEPDTSKASPRPFNKTPLKPPPPSPSKSRKPSVWVSLPKKPVLIESSPEKRKEKPEARSSRRRRHSTSDSYRAPAGSTSIEKPVPTPLSHHAPQRASSSHSSPVPSLPSYDFWPPHSHSGHTPAPVFPMPYSPLPNRTRESSAAPHPEAQKIIVQAMQSLSYLAFGIPPPATSSHFSPHPHPHPQHPSSPWPYPPSYYTHHSQSQPPPYPPYPYYYPPAPHAHPAAMPPFPTTPLTTPGSGGEPPSSSPELSSSPLSGKNKGKKVSFPQKFVQSRSESDSSLHPDTGEPTRKKQGKGKGKASATTSGRSRRDSQDSPSSGTRGMSPKKGDFSKMSYTAAWSEASSPRTRKPSSRTR